MSSCFATAESPTNLQLVVWSGKGQAMWSTRLGSLPGLPGGRTWRLSCASASYLQHISNLVTPFIHFCINYLGVCQVHLSTGGSVQAKAKLHLPCQPHACTIHKGLVSCTMLLTGNDILRTEYLSLKHSTDRGQLWVKAKMRDLHHIMGQSMHHTACAECVCLATAATAKHT